jgi:hypothetical protein
LRQPHAPFLRRAPNASPKTLFRVLQKLKAEAIRVAASAEPALSLADRVTRSIETQGFAIRSDNGPATGEVAVDAGDDVSS